MTKRIDEDDDPRAWKAGVFYGAQRPRTVGQISPGATDQIRALMRQVFAESLPPAVEESAKMLEKRYATVGYILIGAICLTALATTAIALSMLTDRR